MTKITASSAAFDSLRTFVEEMKIEKKIFAECVITSYAKYYAASDENRSLKEIPGFGKKMPPSPDMLHAFGTHINDLSQYRKVSVSFYLKCDVDVTYGLCKEHPIHSFDKYNKPRCIHYFFRIMDLFVEGAIEKKINVAELQNFAFQLKTELKRFVKNIQEQGEDEVNRLFQDKVVRTRKKVRVDKQSPESYAENDSVEMGITAGGRVGKLSSAIDECIHHYSIYHFERFESEERDDYEMIDQNDNHVKLKLLENEVYTELTAPEADPYLNRYIFLGKQEEFLFTSECEGYKLFAIFESRLEQQVYLAGFEEKTFPEVKTIQTYSTMEMALSHIIQLLNTYPNHYKLGKIGNMFTSTSDEGANSYSFETEESLGLKFDYMLS
jgi:hypothetical protein